MQDLDKGDVSMNLFNDLSNKLLHDYNWDDTRKVKETMDHLNTSWINLRQRYATKFCLIFFKIKIFRICNNQS